MPRPPSSRSRASASSVTATRLQFSLRFSEQRPHAAAASAPPHASARHDTVVTLPGRMRTYKGATVQRVSQSGSWSSKVITTCDEEPHSLRGEAVAASHFLLPHLDAFDCETRLSVSDALERGRYGGLRDIEELRNAPARRS
jgi:hypothetical protein